MSLEGMDVDEAQSLAGQLNGYAQALAHITATLTGLAAELSHSWQGPASATFQQHWASQYRPAIDQAAQALADMHTHLVANIQQQVRASDTDPGPSLLARLADGGLLGSVTLAGVFSGISRGWNDVQDGAGWEGLVQTPLDKTLEWDDSPGVQQLSDLLDKTHGTEMLGKLDKAGSILGDVTTGVDVDEAAYALGQGHYGDAVGHAVDASSTALMNTDDPATFLAGFDIALLKKDYQLEQQIDWSQGLPNPLNASNLREDYLPTFQALPGQLVSTLAGIF